MTLQFSPRPGPRERHLARKWNNPLFEPGDRPLDQPAIDEAARLDRENLAAYGAFSAPGPRGCGVGPQ